MRRRRKENTAKIWRSAAQTGTSLNVSALSVFSTANTKKCAAELTARFVSTLDHHHSRRELRRRPQMSHLTTMRLSYVFNCLYEASSASEKINPSLIDKDLLGFWPQNSTHNKIYDILHLWMCSRAWNPSKNGSVRFELALPQMITRSNPDKCLRLLKSI